MKKLFSLVSIVMLALLVSCEGPKPVEKNPVEGTWQINRLTFQGKDPSDILKEIGVQCIFEGTMNLAADKSATFALCDHTVQTTYEYDTEAGVITLVVSDERLGDTEYRVPGTFTENLMTFTLADLLKTIGDVEQVVLDQLAANGIQLEAAQKLLLKTAIDQLLKAEGTAELTRIQ